MRLIVMYDLPMDTAENRQIYTIFRRKMIGRGYVMMQYSVYCKPLNAPTKYAIELKAIKKIAPQEGNIRVLLITENQYNTIKYITGNQHVNELVNNNERFVKI